MAVDNTKKPVSDENVEKLYDEIPINSLKALDTHPMKPDYIFRGQADSGWELTPSIHRNSRTKPHIRDFGEKLTEEFEKKWLLPSPESHSKMLHWHRHILSICQHYRIPTPLLDWTIDWRVAVFFAIEGYSEESIKYDNCDGAIWFLNRAKVEKKLSALCAAKECKNYEHISKGIGKFSLTTCEYKWPNCNPIFFMNAGITDLRMLVQGSVFSYCIEHVDDQCNCICEILGNESKACFKKYIIPKELKNKFRIDLQKYVPQDKIYPNISDDWFNKITDEIIQSIDNSMDHFEET